MSTSERQEKLEQLKIAFDKPGGHQAMRFALATLGALPVIGGGISGAGAFWAEREQSLANDGFLDWALLAESQIVELSKALEKLLREPSRSAMALLLGEILGDQYSSALLSGDAISLRVVLNPSTVSELEPYLSNNWLQIRSTGSVCSMGANNSVGNDVEDLKRPYGFGSEFVLSVTQLGRTPESVAA